MTVVLKVLFRPVMSLDQKFTGSAVVQRIVNGNQDQVTFAFDTPFDTRREATDDAQKRLAEAIANGLHRDH